MWRRRQRRHVFACFRNNGEPSIELEGPFARLSTRAYVMRGQVGHDLEEEHGADLL